MTKWRRKVRLAIGIAAGAYVLFLAWAVRPTGARPKELAGQVAATLAKEAVGIRDRLRFRDFVYDEHREGGSYRIRASEALGFSSDGDDVFRLMDVRVETPGREGRPGMVLRAPRAEFQQGTKALHVYDGVTIEGETASLRGTSFRFDPVKREFLSEGPVTMVRGRMLAHAERGSLETADGRVRLEGNVRMAGTAEEGRFLGLAAPTVTVQRNGTLLASGGVRVLTSEAVLRSESVERIPDATGDRLHTSGETTVLFLSGDAARRPLLASGDLADMSRDQDGFPTSCVLARTAGTARIDLAPDVAAGPRRALAPRFEAAFAEGRLSVVTAPNGLRGAEAVAVDGKPGTGLKTLETEWARFTFLPGGASLDVAVLDRSVRLADGTRSTVTAAKGSFRGRDEVAVFTGTTASPAEYRGESATIRGAVLTWLRKEDRVDASGDVHTVFRGGVPGTGAGSDTEPYYSQSDTLRMTMADRVATLEGNVRAWQKENVLRSAKLTLNDTERTIRAEGNVRAVFRRRPAGLPSAASKPKAGGETVSATGDVLTHRESERMVRIEGNASMVSGSWSMNATVADIRLTKDRAVESAEARGSVVLEDRATSRRGEGSLATWRPETETVTLEGAPATALDGKRNRMTGARLTFRQGRSRVDVESAPGVMSEGSYRPEGS